MLQILNCYWKLSPQLSSTMLNSDNNCLSADFVSDNMSLWCFMQTSFQFVSWLSSMLQSLLWLWLVSLRICKSSYEFTFVLQSWQRQKAWNKFWFLLNSGIYHIHDLSCTSATLFRSKLKTYQVRLAHLTWYNVHPFEHSSVEFNHF